MKPYYEEPDITIYHSKCLPVLKEMDDNSVDSIVTDPPYGIKFMGKKWDYKIPSVEVWKECLRVLKPGGHALIACGTRTQHRMAVNIEDAGFEIRDLIAWVYGSGFPKSLDIGKAIDKAAGAEREVVGTASDFARDGAKRNADRHNDTRRIEIIGDKGGGWNRPITAPATPEAEQWNGWGTALKPAMELWTLARKPINGTVAQNVLEHGTGGINVDGCRVGDNPGYSYPNGAGGNSFSVGEAPDGTRMEPVTSSKGRFPANFIHDGSEEVMALFPQSAGQQGDVRGTEPSHTGQNGIYGEFARVAAHPKRTDSGSAARFFYCAKASKSERNMGLADNRHPTVKPLTLISYLCRLITPPNGLIVDPFVGSGTTGIATAQEGFRFIGIDQDEDACETAVKRLRLRQGVFNFSH